MFTIVIWHIFGRWSQREKHSEIKPPLFDFGPITYYYYPFYVNNKRLDTKLANTNQQFCKFFVAFKKKTNDNY